ncbi:MAG: hypothetical protein ABII18_04075 [bacterium]|nr:hypothetical protein [bacterium]MBU1916506.1 hypothetical protein [bacterium]
MNHFIETILEHHPRDIITDTEVINLFEGSNDRRYGLVKRALARGDIIHIRRGLYYLAKKFQRIPLNPFMLANQIYGPSYVSLESALSFHGLIPEAVKTVVNVCQKNSRLFNTVLGNFDYTQIPQNYFYLGVKQISDSHNQPFLIATPLKALADYVYVHKKNWKNLSEAAHDLRIDVFELYRLHSTDFEIKEAYRNRRVKNFLSKLYEELSHEQRLDSTTT